SPAECESASLVRTRLPADDEDDGDPPMPRGGTPSMRVSCGPTCQQTIVPPWTRGDFRGVLRLMTSTWLSTPGAKGSLVRLRIERGDEDEDDFSGELAHRWGGVGCGLENRLESPLGRGKLRQARGWVVLCEGKPTPALRDRRRCAPPFWWRAFS